MSQAAPRQDPSRGVLVVEDEPHVCELLADLLRDAGFEPHCHSRDSQAYEALSYGRDFACLVVDVNLGSGTTGYDVARFARRLDPEIPVIFVSGEISATSVEVHGVPGGLFLPKPFTAAELMDRVRKLVAENDA